MPRIYPTDWRARIRIFELYGCSYKRKQGSHHIMTCPGAKRAVVIPEYDERPFLLPPDACGHTPNPYWTSKVDKYWEENQ